MRSVFYASLAFMATSQMASAISVDPESYSLNQVGTDLSVEAEGLFGSSKPNPGHPVDINGKAVPKGQLPGFGTVAGEVDHKTGILHPFRALKDKFLRKCPLNHDDPLDIWFGPELDKIGYTTKSYDVTTEDGYILSLLRLVKKGTENNEKMDRGPPAIFQHGLGCASDHWVNVRTNKETGKTPVATVFQALEAGWDVWLGNNRGNRFSRGHTSLRADKDSAYWEFSHAEMGKYDQPANVKQMIKVTGYSKVAYVGHSLGTMQMFYALATEEPTGYLNTHLTSFTALAPCAKVTDGGHFKKLTFGAAAGFDSLHKMLEKSGVMTVNGPNGEADGKLLRRTDRIVGSALSDACVGDGQTISMQVLKHIVQNVKKNSFNEYDPKFTRASMLKESKERAAVVDLGNIILPTMLFVGEKDGTCPKAQADWIKAQMTKAKPEMMVIKGKSHDFTKKNNDYFKHVLEWLDGNKPVKAAKK